MEKANDEMLQKLLDALIQSWLATMSPVEIGASMERLELMIEAREATGGTPSQVVRDVYQEVFLRDVWSGDQE